MTPPMTMTVRDVDAAEGEEEAALNSDEEVEAASAVVVSHVCLSQREF